MAQFVQDLYVVASNGASPAATLLNYKLIGYWDVANAGSHGTGATTGTQMMALYASFLDIAALPSSYHVGEVMMTASDAAAPVPPIPPDGQASYLCRGYWDVDGGGAVGTNGSRGNGMAGLYVRESIGISSLQPYISDVYLTGSNDAFPTLPPGAASNNYHLVGYWDCDSGGSQGTNNTSSGTYMMGLWVQWSPYPVAGS